eukprot:CAMPEP_0175133602 /NCGR_PEP_ID=MMETSP0087-20121206/7737_1 /TAXON_ID=136419 /ORGANISM="Unknown Unknown, Strain D1" /LENGTH=439 /DNA_ID=CAMNT_0016416117 /DNA_START=40 /DNA_END=1355 /DNA_ORIENTATION=+
MGDLITVRPKSLFVALLASWMLIIFMVFSRTPYVRQASRQSNALTSSFATTAEAEDAVEEEAAGLLVPEQARCLLSGLKERGFKGDCIAAKMTVDETDRILLCMTLLDIPVTCPLLRKRWRKLNAEDVTVLPFGVEFEYVFPPLGIRSRLRKFLRVTSYIENMGVPVVLYKSYAQAHVQLENNWKVVPDESLTNGFEVVSPVMQNIQPVRDVMDVMLCKRSELALTGATDFHVHVDTTGATTKQYVNIVKNFVTFEKVMDSFQPWNHREDRNIWLRSVSANFEDPIGAHEDLDDCGTDFKCVYLYSQPLTYFGNRAYKLNMLRKSNNVEFRGHAGTTSSEVVESWVRFTTMFIKGCLDGIVIDPKISLKPTEEQERALFQDLVRDKSGRLQAFFSRRQKLVTAIYDSERFVTLPTLPPRPAPLPAAATAAATATAATAA